MTIQELLDDFAKYSKYDPKQTKFMLGSDTYEFNIRGRMYRTFDFCYMGFERKQRDWN